MLQSFIIVLKRFNEQVKRHQIQFTDNDVFKLTDDEEHDLWSHFFY